MNKYTRPSKNTQDTRGQNVTAKEKDFREETYRRQTLATRIKTSAENDSKCLKNAISFHLKGKVVLLIEKPKFPLSFPGKVNWGQIMTSSREFGLNKEVR